jgi:uncharacterized lipoprotein YmbA
MSRLCQAFCLTMLLAVVFGCGTSPPVHYYSLSQPVAATVAKTGDTVVRDTGNEIQMAEFDRWATAPQSALVPWLAREVDRQLANAVVVAFPSVGHSGAPYRVRGTISQWDTDSAGAATLVVQWDCVMDEHSPVVPLHTSRYTAQAQRPKNYGDVVSALNATLAAFATDVAGTLAATLPASPPP